MNKLRLHIPNLLSLTNALFGGFALYMLLHDQLSGAIWCMMGSMVCDFLDGFMARLLKAFSPLGKDLDSLSDAISFGVVPSVMLFKGLTAVDFFSPSVAFIIIPASVYRLAKFNHDERQTETFLGLPTPANALFLAGFSSFLVENQELMHSLPRMIEYKVVAGYLLLLILLSYLLISEVPMFSLKSIKRGSREMWFLFLVALATISSLLWWGWSGLAVGFGLYIVLNLIPILISLAKSK